MTENEQRERIFAALKMTRINEGICFQGWQTEILVRWIEELKRGCERAEPKAADCKG